MAAVIDLTEEGESPPAARLRTQYYAAASAHAAGPSNPSRNNATASTSTSRRTIELDDSENEENGDNDDDIVFLRSERLHLPAQSHASGRDANHGAMFARLRHHAQTGDNGVFSRDVVGLPAIGGSSNSNNNNLRLFPDDAPLRAHSAYTAPRTLPLHAAGNARNRRGGNTSGPGLAGRRAHQQQQQRVDQHDLFEGLFGGEAPVGPIPRPRGGRQQQQQQQGRFTGVFPPDFRGGQGTNGDGDDEWFDRDYDPAQPENNVDDERNRPRGALYQELLNDELQRNARNANALAAAQRQHQHQPGWLGQQLRRLVGMHDGGWLGGGGRGGNYLPPPPAYPAGWQIGPGGTFNVRRKVKNYSVRASHPKFDKRRCKGFERDVVPPPELDEMAQQAAIEKEDDKENAPPPALSAKRTDKGKGKAKAEDQDELLSTTDSQIPAGTASQLQEVPPLDLDAASASQSEIPATPAQRTRTIRAPVCASCLSPLFLNEPAKRRPHLLVCGHVVCASCIRAAKDRVEAWYDAQARAALEEALKSDDDEEMPMPGGTAKWKGADVNEKFEVVEGAGEDSESSNISVKTGMKRRRGGAGAARAKGRLPVNDRDRKTRKPVATATGPARSTAAAADASQSIRLSNKGKGKAIQREADDNDDDGEWRPDTAEDEGTAGTSTSGTTDDSEPSRKKARTDATSATSNRPSRTRRRGDGTIPNMRESPLEGGEQDAGDADFDDDIMNDGPRQPTANSSKKGKGKASHLSIPLTAGAEKSEMTSKGKKGKQKAAAAVEEDPCVDRDGIARINKEWMACPVVGCPGDTDLQSDIGSRKGAWEMFV